MGATAPWRETQMVTILPCTDHVPPITANPALPGVLDSIPQAQTTEGGVTNGIRRRKHHRGEARRVPRPR